mmetsp:Transcript_39579/g.82220  ORF Transcript_39579/g.82220 Transcript_39579/m.82220 type:complete len:210 (+) Transcript_39579:282-911(+)
MTTQVIRLEFPIDNGVGENRHCDRHNRTFGQGHIGINGNLAGQDAHGGTSRRKHRFVGGLGGGRNGLGGSRGRGFTSLWSRSRSGTTLLHGIALGLGRRLFGSLFLRTLGLLVFILILSRGRSRIAATTRGSGSGRRCFLFGLGFGFLLGLGQGWLVGLTIDAQTIVVIGIGLLGRQQLLHQGSHITFSRFLGLTNFFAQTINLRLEGS